MLCSSGCGPKGLQGSCKQMNLLVLGKWHLSLKLGIVVVRIPHGALGRESNCGNGKCKGDRSRRVGGQREDEGDHRQEDRAEEGPGKR